MLYANPKTLREMGDKLGQNFTEGELGEVCMALRHAAGNLWSIQAMGLAGDMHEDDIASLDSTRTLLNEFADGIEAGERKHREDHPE